MYFPLTGFGSALAAVLLFSLAYHHFAKIPLSEGDKNLYHDLSKLFGFVMAFTLVFFLWRTIVGGASATASEFAGFRHMLGSGWYHLALWVGLVIPLVLIAMPAVRPGEKIHARHYFWWVCLQGAWKWCSAAW
jgi:molybdopterin-containing oxidoreductase family membrane subunit